MPSNECKRHERGAKAQVKSAMVVLRADKQEWLAVLRTEDYLKLLKEKENGKVPQKASSD